MSGFGLAVYRPISSAKSLLRDSNSLTAPCHNKSTNGYSICSRGIALLKFERYELSSPPPCRPQAPMLDIHQPRMLYPSSSPSYLGPSPLHDMLAFDGSKLSPAPGHLYVRQQHAIIQLVEGPPPSPRDITSVVQSSASAHSSYPSTSDSEEECTSYCSSVMTPDESTNDYAPVPYDNSFYSRMKRVYEWRNGFMPAADTCNGMYSILSVIPAMRLGLDAFGVLDVLPSSPQKRKLDSYQAEYDDVSFSLSHSFWWVLINTCV